MLGLVLPWYLPKGPVNKELRYIISHFDDLLLTLPVKIKAIPSQDKRFSAYCSALSTSSTSVSWLFEPAGVGMRDKSVIARVECAVHQLMPDSFERGVLKGWG